MSPSLYLNYDYTVEVILQSQAGPSTRKLSKGGVDVQKWFKVKVLDATQEAIWHSVGSRFLATGLRQKWCFFSCLILWCFPCSTFDWKTDWFQYLANICKESRSSAQLAQLSIPTIAPKRGDSGSLQEKETPGNAETRGKSNVDVWYVGHIRDIADIRDIGDIGDSPLSHLHWFDA